MGIVARDPVVFRSVVDAFEAGDGKLFQHLLAELRVGDACEVICAWLRSKESVLECLEVCGPPPRQPVTVEQVARYAHVVSNLSQDEFLARRLVDAVEDRDSVAFKAVVAELGAEEFCHLLCHWVSVVRYRLICEVVCSEQEVQTDQVVAELVRASAAVGRLAKKNMLLKSAIAAAVAFDPDSLSDILGGFGDCQLICEWFCSWRCVWICLPFCQSFPIPEMKDPIEEMREFALFSTKLAENKDAFPRLLAALQSGDSKSYAALVTEFKAERYCLQLCHWFCYEVCSRFCIVVCPPPSLLPVFTAIGGYEYLTQVNSALGGNGLTHDNRAFSDLLYSSLRLNGILTQTLGGLPMEYRFEYVTYDAKGNLSGSWTPVPINWIARTVIGLWEHFTGVLPNPIETKVYTVNGTAGPNEMVATISADGWIQVPQQNDVMSPQGAFFPNGNMIQLISHLLPGSFAPEDETGVTAGNAANITGDLYFGIRMRVRQQGNPASETDGGTCVHAAINNTPYNNINQHPEWDGGAISQQLAVCMVDVKELQGAGCAGLDGSLTVLFTAAHPNLGSVNLSMKGNGGAFSFTLPAIPTAGNYYGTATPNGWTIGSLPSCAYLVTLQVMLLLTDGDNVPDPLYDQIAFCKQ
jgi:hypothetical protein